MLFLRGIYVFILSSYVNSSFIFGSVLVSVICDWQSMCNKKKVIKVDNNSGLSQINTYLWAYHK